MALTKKELDAIYPFDNMKIVPYMPENAEVWDSFIKNCPMATFLHSRRFLSYHGERFNDVSLMFFDEGKLRAVLPAAANADSVISHSGATYGGIMHDGWLHGNRMLAALSLAATHYASGGFKKLHYKPVPFIFQQRVYQDDIYALFRLGAVRVRSDLSTAINLRQPGRISSGRKGSRDKSRRAGVCMVDAKNDIGGVWNLIRDNLQRKHSLLPTHSAQELQLLAELFPKNIFFRAAKLHGEGDMLAAGVLFKCNNAIHTQYLAASESGRAVCALDGLIFGMIEELSSETEWFSFGVSTENGGQVLNQSLYEFKQRFGGSGVVHDFYVIEL